MTWNPYCGVAPTPAEIVARWNFDPWLLAGLLAVGLVYIAMSGAFAARRRRVFGAAFLLALFLFVSPFCALSSALFSARVVHHVLLTVALAPLLVMSLPRERLRMPGGLVLWTAAQAVLFWLWHAPPVYAWALSSDAAYWLMQASLLLSAMGFWAVLRRVEAPAAMLGLLATMVQMGLLGALITFAGTPLYAPHFLTTTPWGLSALQDQQLAGLVMWVPGAGFYLAAALFLLNRWMDGETRAVPAR
jgi:putative membrane protein